MKLYTTIAVTVIVILMAVSGVRAQGRSTHKSRVESLATAAIHEPVGYTAACFATNLDTVSHILVAEIFDWRGDNVTETSSCGVPQGPGITCQSTAQYRDSALRCVVSTDGRATDLRGSISTSKSPYPFTRPARSTLPAQ